MNEQVKRWAMSLGKLALVLVLAIGVLAASVEFSIRSTTPLIKIRIRTEEVASGHRDAFSTFRVAR